MALQITNFRVDVDGGEGLTFPCVTLLNRRGGGAPVLLRWVFQRTLEILLFRRTDGGSTGAIWKALHNTGLQSTSLLCDRKAVTNGVLEARTYDSVQRHTTAALWRPAQTRAIAVAYECSAASATLVYFSSPPCVLFSTLGSGGP